MTILQLLTLKQIGFLTPLLQLVIICVLFIITTIVQYKNYKQTGKMWTYYPLNTWSFFAPIYEEIIFRGLIFVGLMSLYSLVVSIIISSILFGLWHLKNIFWLPKKELIYQMLYTGIIFGPIMVCVTIYTDSIWLAVILHYLNNLGSVFMEKK